MHNYINILVLVFSESNNISSAADLGNVLGNFCAEILNMNSLTNMLQERHSVNLIPKKVKNLLAENFDMNFSLIQLRLLIRSSF
jgi:hypothetical protein